MKVASHNSLTYLPVKQWWLKPFAFMSRCQSKPLAEQLKITDLFDFRVRFTDSGPVFAHGLAEYEWDWTLFETLDEYGKTVSRPYVIVSLEWTSDYGAESQKNRFAELCSDLETRYPNIKFCGGSIKKDWTRVYSFAWYAPSYKLYTASTTGTVLDDWWPWLFAETHNKKALEKHTSDQYLMIDFI